MWGLETAFNCRRVRVRGERNERVVVLVDLARVR